MVLFFFYKNMSNIELIKKINSIFTINDGYVLIENYEDNILTINNNNRNYINLLMSLENQMIDLYFYDLDMYKK